MGSIKKITLASVCIALCVVLPIALHSIPDAGTVFLPMHIPVPICGWPCGLMGPLLSSIITALPGIVIQLVFLPGVVLVKAKVIPLRYSKKAIV